MSRLAASIVAFALLTAASGAAPGADRGPARPTGAFEHSDVASAIADLLTAPGADSFALPKVDAEAVRTIYAARDYHPIWLWENGLNTRARRLMAQLATAAADGLQPTEYLPPSLVSFDDGAGAFTGNPLAMARLELEVTRAALAYARHASGGRVDPASVDRNMAIVPQTVPPDVALAVLAGTVRPDRYLAGLLPRSDSYVVLKAALADYRNRISRTPSAPIPGGALIRPGDEDERVRQIRLRLIELGEFALKVSEDTGTQAGHRTAAEAALVSPHYDAALVAAVRQFQLSRNLSADEVVGPSTIRALNDTGRSELNTILINMERMRWLPRSLGRRHIIVNQAAFRLRLYDQTELVHSARVVVGKRGSQTPVFAEEMEHIVFNPYWNVPRSIARKEMLPKLLEDPDFLSRQGYEVFVTDAGRTERIDSAEVDWSQAQSESVAFSVRQPPGRGNALGRLKFMFPNRFNIYLHDTPSKSLFERSSRAFSHGCVRLQHPEKLAEILLGWDKGWDRAKVIRMLDSGRNRFIYLNRKIPIYLTYFTAWMGDDGSIEFLDDVYGRDAALTRALAQPRLAMK